MIKKILAGMISAAVLMTTSSCASNEDNFDGITLTVLGKKTDMEKSYMKKIFEQYEIKTGIRLNIEAIEDGNYEVEAEKRLLEGNAPDIFMHFNNADLNRFNIPENFLYLNDEKWVDDLTDNALEYCLDNKGNLLGLPFWESSVSGCYYNKTILDSLGLKAASTQDEFNVLCEVLKESGYTPICWPADGCTWMFQFGFDPIFADEPELLASLNDGQINYSDIPQVRDMVQWIHDAADNGWFGENYLNTGWNEISSDLSSGNAVMTFIWDTWFYTDFEQGGKYTVDDFALMPVFMNTVENGTYEGGNLNMMMVCKNGKNAESAKEFLDFCAAPENYNYAFDGISTVNCFKGQTTNIQSGMVTDSAESIAAYERISVAVSRIVGYSADDIAEIFNEMFRKETDVNGCVALMDEFRHTEASSQARNITDENS